MRKIDTRHSGIARAAEIRDLLNVEAYEHPTKRPFTTENLPRGIACVEPDLETSHPLTVKENILLPTLRLSHLSPEVEVHQKAIMQPAASARASRDLSPGTETNIELQAPGDMFLFHQEWDQIQKLRRDILSQRSEVHEMRMILREKQNAKSVGEDKLLQRIFRQQFNVLESEEKSILELAQISREARDEYGPIEYDLNQLEDSLSGKEFRLSQLESSFYSRVSENAAMEPRSAASHSPTSVEPSPQMTMDELETSQDHPLVTRFLSRWGDLDLLQESLDDFEEMRDFLEEKRESWKQMGRELNQEDQDWLNSAEKEHRALNENIATTERDVEDLKQQCLKRGLVDENGDPTDFQSQERSTFSEEDVNPGPEVSEYVKYPSLLPHPARKQRQIHAQGPKPDSISDKTSCRINDWLLDRLRSSPLDVNLLARTFEDKAGKINDYWEGAVLSFWYEDGTTSNAAAIRVYTSRSSMKTKTSLRVSESSSITEHAFFMGISPASPRGKFSWSSD